MSRYTPAGMENYPFAEQAARYSKIHELLLAARAELAAAQKVNAKYPDAWDMDYDAEYIASVNDMAENCLGFAGELEYMGEVAEIDEDE